MGIIRVTIYYMGYRDYEPTYEVPFDPPGFRD